MAAWIFLGIVVVAVALFVGAYNSLVQLRNRVKNAWSQIDVQLKRRHDLIPNLVETAKGYMTHERETLSAVTEARSRAMGAGSVTEKGAAETQLTQALSRFMVVVENYPDLKANQNFLSLQEELTSTENKIAFARQSLQRRGHVLQQQDRDVPVQRHRGHVQLPSGEFFEIEEPAQREAPKVSFTR